MVGFFLSAGMLVICTGCTVVEQWAVTEQREQTAEAFPIKFPRIFYIYKHFSGICIYT